MMIGFKLKIHGLSTATFLTILLKLSNEAEMKHLR
jgi:hypothetical protein